MAANEPDFYRKKYYELKKKLKFLLYENEFYQDSLRQNQQKLLKITKDKHFLLDRLLKYERPESSSDTGSDSSGDENARPQKRKMDPQGGVGQIKKRRNTMSVKRTPQNSKFSMNDLHDSSLDRMGGKP